jgi:hypothetical protein
LISFKQPPLCPLLVKEGIKGWFYFRSGGG